MNPDLLSPCPFCGGAAEADERIERVGQNRHQIIIRCTACPATMDVTLHNASHSSLVAMRRNMMLENWNRRIIHEP